MTPEWRALRHTGHGRLTPPWPEFGRYVIVALIFALMLLLGMSMAHHRFFRGGHVDHHGVVSP